MENDLKLCCPECHIKNWPNPADACNSKSCLCHSKIEISTANRAIGVWKIKWRDSQLYFTQESTEGKWEVSEVDSVGYIIAEDDDKIVLAGDVINGDVRRIIVIPRENVIKVYQ